MSFAIKNADALDAKAQEAAIANAQARAGVYAKAAGVNLGGASMSISEVATEAPRPMMRVMALAGNAAPTPTAAGEQSVTANVTVVFEIR